MMREFVFKTSAAANPLCRFTRDDPDRWILIQLYRMSPTQAADDAMFVISAPPGEADRFLRSDFGKRYGTYELVHQNERLTSVKVSNYAMPAYRGMDPVELTIQALGPEVFFEPILVHGGFIHVRVLAVDRPGSPFGELVRRLSTATDPTEFRLIHQGTWNPIRRLVPRDEGLSERQEETLRMAVEMGYYDAPRRCTLEDLAQAFGVSKAAVHKHLQAAESKIIRSNAP